MKDWSKGMVSGEEHYGKDDEIRTVVRILDRKNRHEEGSYYEHITDTDTGRIIRSVSERFVDHQGRGSAKKAIPDFSDEWVAVAAYYIWQEQGCPMAGTTIGHGEESAQEDVPRGQTGCFRTA